MLLTRYFSNLEPYIVPGKALIIYGPRRVGKTTLIQQYLETTPWKYKLDSGDNIQIQQILGSQDFSQILHYAEGYDLLVIDEAQNIPNIGMGLKILVDQIPTIRVIATGSSSFELAGQVGEPLTGRKQTLTLYPMAQMELLKNIYNSKELQERLHEYLIYGSYPEVVSEPTQKGKVQILEELVNSYLLKDVLTLADVKGSRILSSILKLLAFQIGSQVSLNEIANSVNIDVKTVARYLDLLEKAFVIVGLRGFSRNLRNEVTSKAKYYFLDNGIRNGIIAQFNKLDLRDDIGKLWENFIFIERLKYRTYNKIYSNAYFWRTYSQQEIDLVEDKDGKLQAFEFKWSEKRKTHAPNEWKTTYPDAIFSVINTSNYLEFIS
jgi:uncharacterized protein